jgi:histidinol-phosphate aminotransferase
MDWKALLRPEIARMSAYQVDQRVVRIKLDANESPYPLPEIVQQKVLALLEKTEIHRYPDAEARQLKRELGRWIGVPEEWLLLGNGSDELIQMIVMTFGKEDAYILFPDPTFVMYQMAALSLGQRPHAVPLTETWDLSRSAMLEAIQTVQPRIVFLSYPNNPTANCFQREAMEQVLRSSPGIVVIDEAYFPFSRKTFLPLLAQHENLLILRTLSKIGMAGLRVGVLIGQPVVINEINKIRTPYNLNVLSQLVAQVALQEWAVIEPQIAQIVTERERIYPQLQTIPGITVFPSEANFFLLRCAQGASKLWEYLVEQGILVRRYPGHPLLKDYLRVTVGQPTENDELCRCMRDYSQCAD